MTNEFFDRFLTAGFRDANRFDFSVVLADFDLNYKQFLPPQRDARILDFGCGMGHFLYYLKQRGFTNFWGIDVGHEQIDFCRENVTKNVELVQDSVSFLQASIAEYDMIVMRDVIEHIPKADLLQTLQALHNALRPEGILLVETGNMSAWTGTYLLYQDFTHQVGFTERSLRQVLIVAGFQDIQLFGANPQLSRRYWLLRTVWELCLRLIYTAERGPAGVPTILSKLLIATAKK